MSASSAAVAGHRERRRDAPQYDLITATYSWDIDVADEAGQSSGSGSSGSRSGLSGGDNSNAVAAPYLEGAVRRPQSFSPTSPNFPGAGAGTDDETQGLQRYRGVRIARTGIEDQEGYDEDEESYSYGAHAHSTDRLRHFDTHVTSYIIDAVLARVRNVGEAHGAPDSVHEAARHMRGRKSLAPPSSLMPMTFAQSRLRGSLSPSSSSYPSSSSSSSPFSFLRNWGQRSRSASWRTKQLLLSPKEAPSTVGAATGMLGRGALAARAGPHASLALPDVLQTSMSIGTGAAGGPHAVVSTPLQEPFSVFVPPPFRIVFLIALGLLCWAANLRGLRRMGIDADGMVSNEPRIKVLPQHRARGEQLMASSAASTTTASSSRTLVGSADSEIAVFFRHPWLQETAAFHLGLVCCIWGIVCWVAYRLYAFHTIFYGGEHMGSFAEARGRHAQALQGIAIFGLLLVAVWPGDVLYRGRRKALGKLFLRVCSPSLYQRINFSDVILADILTSFARVFGDMWLTMCFLWPTSDTPAWWNGKGSIAVPLLVSLPYLVRFRQCLSEYNTSTTDRSAGLRAFRPLMNAAKYFSAFPVIWLSVLQTKGTSQDDPLATSAATSSFYFWIISVFVNSLYSFWWDVTNDWGLEMFSWNTWASTPSRIADGVRSLHRRGVSTAPRPSTRHAQATSSLHGEERHSSDGMVKSSSKSSHLAPSFSHSRSESRLLRSDDNAMLFPPIAYQLAVTIDLLLRFAWSLKLSSHLSHIIELESTAFYLEALEILRRWMWTYLRIEWEACRRRAWENDGSMESLTLATLRSGAANGSGSATNGNAHLRNGDVHPVAQARHSPEEQDTHLD